MWPPENSQCFSEYALHCATDYEDQRPIIYQFLYGLKREELEQMRRNSQSKEKEKGLKEWRLGGKGRGKRQRARERKSAHSLLKLSLKPPSTKSTTVMNIIWESDLIYLQKHAKAFLFCSLAIGPFKTRISLFEENAWSQQRIHLKSIHYLNNLQSLH